MASPPVPPTGGGLSGPRMPLRLDMPTALPWIALP